MNESEQPESSPRFELTGEYIEEWVQNKEHTRHELRQVLLHVSQNLDSYQLSGQLDQEDRAEVEAAIHDGMVRLYQGEVADINQRHVDNPGLGLQKALDDLWPVAANLKADFEADDSPLTDEDYAEILELIQESVFEYFQAHRTNVSPQEFAVFVQQAYAEGMLSPERYNSLLRG